MMKTRSLWKCVLMVPAAVVCIQGSRKPAMPKLPREFAGRFAYIPPTSTIVDGRPCDLPGFFIAKWEVTNAEYKEFLSTANGRDRQLMIDTSGWTRSTFDGDVLADRYHSLKDHPVVNISQKAAERYCHWLAERMNSEAERDVIIRSRLPSRQEWILAATGGSDLSYSCGDRVSDWNGKPMCNYRRIEDDLVSHDWRTGNYSVMDPQRNEDPSMRRPSSDPRGIHMRISGARIATHSTLRDPTVESPIAPSRSFFANRNGLFNMSGNVAEMIDSAGVAIGGSWLNTGYDVRVSSLTEFVMPTPWIGFRPVLEIVTP